MLSRGCYQSSLRAPKGPLVFVCLALAWVNPSCWTSVFRPESPVSRKSSDLQQNAPQQPPLQQASPQQTVNPPVLKRPPFRLAMLRKLYQCADGVQLTVLPEHDSVRVTLNGKIYDLKLVPSNTGGSGTKYNAGAITWSFAGDTGTLQDATNPTNPATLAKGCHQQSILPPASPANSIQGTLNFVLRTDLPATAQIRIQLLDLKASGESPKTVGLKTFNLMGRKPPIPFDFPVDSASAHPADCCALYAEILVDGKPQYATAKPFPIPDLPHPGQITLNLEPLHRQAAQP